MLSRGNQKTGAQKTRAIVCFVEDNKHLIQQALALRHSWLYVQSPDTDMVVMGTPAALRYIPDDVVKIEQRAIADDPEWLSYRFSNSVACLNGVNAWQIDRYSHILLTDVDTFITPAWNSFYPDGFVCGNGGYSNDDDVRRRILEIAAEFGFQHRGLVNTGATWYGPTPLVRRMAAVAEMLVPYILSRYFREDEGAWPGWYRGVSGMYAAEIAINHLAPGAEESSALDYSSMSKASVHDHPHIHCWHTDEKFSKYDFMCRRYSEKDAKNLNLEVIADYAMEMSFRSLRDLAAAEATSPLETGSSPPSIIPPPLNLSGTDNRGRQAAFELICACLFSPEGTDHPEETFDCPASSGEIRWANVVHIATDHLVAPAIGYRIEQSGLGKALPEAVTDYFASMLRLNRIRNEQVAGEIVEIAALLNQVGIIPLLIKGSASLMSDLHGDPGVRVMSDIDMLVRPERIPDCLEILVKSGYALRRDDHPFAHSVGSLTRIDTWSPIDLHRHVLTFPYRQLLATEDLIAQSVEIKRRGIKLAVPSATHQVVLNVAHAQLHDKNYTYGHIPLRALYDLHRLSLEYPRQIAWEEVEQRFTLAGHGLPLDYHIEAAALVTKRRFPRLPRGFSGSRLLLGRALWLVRHPGLHRIDNRLLRAALQVRSLAQALFKTELRNHLFRNLGDPLWRHKRLAFMWHGRKTV